MAALFSTYLTRAIRSLAQMVRGFPEAILEPRPAFRLREVSLVAQRMREAAVAVLDSRKVVNTELSNMRQLNQLSTHLVAERSSFEGCLVEITKTAVAISEADKGNLQLYDHTSGSLTIAAQQGFQADFLKFFDSVRGNDTACGVAMGTAKQIIVDDVLTSAIFAGQTAQKVLLDRGSARRRLNTFDEQQGKAVGGAFNTFHSTRPPQRAPVRADKHTGPAGCGLS